MNSARLAPAVLAALLVGVQTQQSPRGILRDAVRAVAGDSVARVQARWEAEWRRDSTARLAGLGLAALARMRNDPLTAERVLAALTASTFPSDITQFYALLEHATLLGERGQIGAADSAGERAIQAARRLGDRAALAEALIRTARMRVRTRGPDAADSVFREAVAQLPPNDTELQALYSCSHAEALVVSHRAEARVEAERGAELARQAGLVDLRPWCLHLVAADLLRAGNPDSALVIYRDVIATTRELHLRRSLASALQWRGFVLSAVGALGDARRDLLEAAQVGEEADVESAEAWALNNLASLSLSVGDIASANNYARRAARLFATQSDRYGTATTLDLQGSIAAALGNMVEAKLALRGAAEQWEAGGFAGGVTGAHLALAHLALQASDLPEMGRELASARRAAQRGGMAGLLPFLQYNDGLLALRRGDLAQAERTFRAARDQSGAGLVRYAAGARLAEVRTRRGDLAAAERELTAASDELDRWRDHLDDRELRMLAFQAAPDNSDPDLGIATVIAALATHGRVETAFTLAERRRARDLLDQLHRAEALREGGPQHRAAPPTADGLSASAVRAALPEDSTALLEFVVGRGGEPTTVFVISRGGIVATTTRAVDSLAPDIERALVLLQAGQTTPGPLRRLGDALLTPVLPLLPPEVKRLVIVPDGALHRVPFDALRLADQRLAVERFSTGVVPSGAVAMELWRRADALPHRAMLAMGDPAFPDEVEAGSAAEVYRGAFAANGGLSRLAASAREVRAAARYAERSRVLLREAASEAWLKRSDLAPFAVLHLATHALVDEASITHSALALSPGGGEDGFLSPGDLAGLKLDADLVLLSACNTAGGVLIGGEGVQGLTAPLLIAGARAVVATRWPIGDRATVQFVEDFYRSLANGLNVGDALRAAKLSAVAAGRSTREWAAFEMVGNPLTRVPLRPAPARGSAWTVVAALAVAALLWIAYRATRRVSGTERH